MRYKTHLATTLAITLPVMDSAQALTMSGVALLAVGAVFPDIDEPNSYIGRRLKGVSGGVKGLFGHRGLTHSLVGLIAISYLFYIIAQWLSFPVELIQWFSLGYLAHLIEDSFSKKGIAWLQPFSKKSFQSGFKIIYYSTGGLAEQVIFFVSLVAILYHLTQLRLDDLSFVYLNRLAHNLF
ncbi:metal-dependent hydrolase [Marinilactibacillus kalidii]|uniref:metal-dependent hydrolase n=1 Tax=Marinilactibacillus kalidii TaxID=2820274 RepID=UPI001ABE28C5